MIHRLLLLGLFFSLMPSVLAQDLYTRNRPFKGPTAGSGVNMLVGLREISAVFELPVAETGGAHIVGDAAAGLSAKAGEAIVNGKVLAVTPGETGVLVNLKEFCEAAGLTYRFNKDFNSIDVAMSTSKNAGAASEASLSSSGSGEPIYINKDTPGEAVEVPMSLAERGKVTLFFWFAQEQDKGYRECFSGVDVFAKSPNVLLYKVNVGSDESPLAKKYPGMTPRLVVINRAGRAFRVYNVHSILSTFKNPEARIAEWMKAP